MKKLLTKYWGVLLIITLLSTLFVGTTVTPASAGTLAWSPVATPDSLGITNQIGPAGCDVAQLKVAPNGDLFCIDANVGTMVYKSVNGGITWTPSVAMPATIVDIAVSPSYATDHTVFALRANAPAQVYISVNAGLSFSVLGGAVTAGYTGTSIAVSPTYNAGSGEIMVGTQQAAAATYGDVFMWGRSGVLNWVAQAVGEDVVKVAYSPNFAIDATRIIVSSNVASGTRVHTLIATDAGVDLTLTTAATVDAATQGTGDASAIASATVAFPSDFNASSPFSRTMYVGTVSAGVIDNTFRLTVGSAAAAVALTPLAFLGITDDQTSSLAYSGTSAAGTLFFGSTGAFGTPWVVYTSSPTGTAAAVSASWVGSFGPATGATNASVALATDYATSKIEYVGTSGANSALSVSTDGLYFRQVGFIDTTVTSISDFKAVDASTYFMATESAAVAANVTSVWKSTDAGTTWARYYSIPKPAAGAVSIQLSPSYATDSTAVVALINNTVSGAATNMYVTNNGGTSWTGKVSPLAINDIAVKDMYTFYVGNAGAASTVQATANGGWTWQPAATTVVAGANAITDIDYDAASGDLLCGNAAGGVYISLDNNATWIPKGAGVGGTNTVVAFDAKFSTNGFIYAASRVGGTADVKRYNTGYAAWLAVGSTVTAGSVQDLLTTADGSLYISNNVTGGGIARSINPTAGYPTLTLASWNNVATSLGATVQFTNLAAASNTIFALDSSAGALASDRWIYAYTDTLAPGTTTSVPVTTSPAAGAIFAAPSAVALTWNAVAGATQYQVMYDTRADFATATVSAVIGAPVTSLVITGLASGATYYWMVHVTLPVAGPWSAPITFLTQLAPAAANAPAIVGNGGAGSTAAGGTAVALVPTFSWGNVPGATAFEFQLAMDPAMTEVLVDDTGKNALPATTAYKLTGHTLKYSTTYYWRVRAVSATSSTGWSTVQAFTTMDEPVVVNPTPTYVLPTQTQVVPTIILPTPTVVVPAATTVSKEINPTYIWAIIIIGAVLVIAVIVLIVRTRRSV